MICQLGNKFEQNIKESKVFRIYPGFRILEKQYLYLRHNLINMTEKKTKQKIH